MTEFAALHGMKVEDVQFLADSGVLVSNRGPDGSYNRYAGCLVLRDQTPVNRAKLVAVNDVSESSSRRGYVAALRLAVAKKELRTVEIGGRHYVVRSELATWSASVVLPEAEPEAEGMRGEQPHPLHPPGQGGGGGGGGGGRRLGDSVTLGALAWSLGLQDVTTLRQVWRRVMPEESALPWVTGSVDGVFAVVVAGSVHEGMVRLCDVHPDLHTLDKCAVAAFVGQLEAEGVEVFGANPRPTDFLQRVVPAAPAGQMFVLRRDAKKVVQVFEQ